MNKARRKAIDELVAKFEDLKCDIESIQEEEQEYLDNMPESLQESEKATIAQEAIDNLEEAFNSIEEAIESLGTAAQ